jgi:hypothetical protein
MNSVLNDQRIDLQSIATSPLIATLSEVPVPPLLAPKSFFGHRVTIQTAVNLRKELIAILEESERLYHALWSGAAVPRNTPKQIKSLRARADLYYTLAKEAEETLSTPSSHTPLSEQSVFQSITAESSNIESHPPSLHTLLPEHLPSSFVHYTPLVNDRPSLGRKQQRQLKKAADYEKRAISYLREVRYYQKNKDLLQERGESQRVQHIQGIIREMEGEAAFCSMEAERLRNSAYGESHNSPGAYQVTNIGDYPIEFRSRSASPATRAHKITKSQSYEDLIRLPKTKAIPVQQGSIAGREQLANQKNLSTAHNLENVKEVTAEFPKNLKWSSAEARIL